MSATRIGWLISAAIIVLVAAALSTLLLPPGIGRPTPATTGPGALDAITLTVDPTQLVSIPTGGSGAAPLYADMIKTAIGKGDWHDFHDFKQKVDDTDKPQDDPQFAAILDKIQAAAVVPLAPGDLIFDQLRITPLSDVHTRDILYGIGKMGGKAALGCMSSNDDAKARKIFEAVFIFGYRLWNNGPYSVYRESGLADMGEAAAGLELLFKDTHDPKEALATAVEQDTGAAGQKWLQKENRTCPSLNPNPGDMVNLALHDKERAWRIEGIMWLGVAKWTGSGPKERILIDKFLNEQSHASDALYAQTAAQAAAFSEDDKNQIPTF